MNNVPLPADFVLPELLQGQWTTAIICTYGADLTFFETRILKQLAQVPLRIVLADEQELNKTLDEMARTMGHNPRVNRTYFASPIHHARAAHVKLILLLGPTSGLMIVGSGNLGYEGYAAPGELWNVFSYSDEAPHHRDEFAAARQYIDALGEKGLLDSPAFQLIDSAWGESIWLEPSPRTLTATVTNLKRPIIEQLHEAASEPVEELIAYAPFHDADCVALQRLIDIFNPKLVRLLLTRNTSADPSAIERVLASAARSRVEEVQIKDDPGAYIHAKWVHLIHSRSETLLTGSANISRSALLRTAANGNLEMGVISTREPRAFEGIYSYLKQKTVDDVASLGISYQHDTDQEVEKVVHPIVLWSRLDGNTLTLVFDQPLPEGTVIDLQYHPNTRLAWDAITLDMDKVVLHLTRDCADLVAGGGKIQVRVDGKDTHVSFTWPYQLNYLHSRLDKVQHRDLFPRLGELPEHDDELHELLLGLEQSLIIDRASVWQITKPSVPEPQSPSEDEPAIRLEDLDWVQLGRAQRYGAYFPGARTRGLPPTDVQIMLAAIAGRLGEIGIEVNNGDVQGDEDLAYEGDTMSSEAGEAEALEEELEDELARRRLPVSTRTRMAFDRFARRYAAALDDLAFLTELGPIPAVTNAVIFNSLLSRLLDRQAISPIVAIAAQIKTWQFLWGGTAKTGIVSNLVEDDADTVREHLANADDRSTTLRGLAASLEYTTEIDTSLLQGIARHLLIDETFNLDTEQLIKAAGGPALASHLIDTLETVAKPASDTEILELVIGPHNIDRGRAEWRLDKVQRSGREARVHAFTVMSPIANLTHSLACEMLGHVAVASHYAGHEETYFRIRFEGNDKAIAFWDDTTESGVIWLGGDESPLKIDSITKPWPAWAIRVEQLRIALRNRSYAAA